MDTNLLKKFGFNNIIKLHISIVTLMLSERFTFVITYKNLIYI